MSVPSSQLSVSKVAIVAALEREVALLVKRWRRVDRDYEGHRFTFYEGDVAVLICGGIGPVFARRATEAAIALYRCPLVVSAGFAGALVPGLKAGKTIFPAAVVDAEDGSRWESVVGDTKVGPTEFEKGILVSFPSVTDPQQKARLAQAFGAQIVDMEAAAVARGAEARGVPFIAAKAISDEWDLTLPAMDQFVRADGKFSTMRFVLHILPRPWWWANTVRLARNSRKAALSLSRWLGNDALWTSVTLGAFGKQGTVIG